MKERPILFNAPKARALLDDTKTQTRRWAIHIPGPDDIYAAPSQDAARHMAEKHNEAMRAWFERNPGKKENNCWPAVESTTASVIEWPFEDGHAEALKEFNAAEWGLEGGAADKVVAELEMSKMKTYAASISPIAKERDELRAALAERDAKGKTMIDFKLQATGIPESIEQYQLALDAAFTAGKAIAAGAAPPNVLMNQLINDKVELQHKLDDALHKADAERDAAQTDAKRLEWLSQQGVSFGFQDIYEGNKWEIGGPYATLRIAIDAEMKGEQP